MVYSEGLFQSAGVLQISAVPINSAQNGSVEIRLTFRRNIGDAFVNKSSLYEESLIISDSFVTAVQKTSSKPLRGCMICVRYRISLFRRLGV